MHLMTNTKIGFFAHELRRQLGHKRYEPIWYLMQKIREYMGKANIVKPLMESVAVDDIYINTNTSEEDRMNLKRGKGIQKKTKAIIMIESIPLEVDGKQEMYMGNMKIEVNDSETSMALDKVVQLNINQNSIVFS